MLPHEPFDIRALRERIRGLHAQGKGVHQHFLVACNRGDWEAMRGAVDEQTAINTEATRLVHLLREHMLWRIDRLHTISQRHRW